MRERKGNGIRLRDKHSSLKMRVYVIRENMLAWAPIDNRNKYNNHILHVKMAIESKGLYQNEKSKSQILIKYDSTEKRLSLVRISYP